MTEQRLEERLVALRGATTVDADTSEAVMVRTRELLSALLERNGVDHDQLVSIIFTSTKDLRSAFPALAARELGLGDVPLLCAGELDVVGGNPNTIRVLLRDDQIADIATFIRAEWGNNAGPVTAAEVAALREHTDPSSDKVIVLQMR